MYNDDQPTYLPKVPRIIAIGDVHGDLGRLTHTLLALGIISPNMEWIAEPNDTIVIQMGDQVDSKARSPNTPNWETVPDTEVVFFMDRLDRIARPKGGRALSLLGNHEIMNVLGDFSYVSNKSLNPLRAAHFRPGGLISNILAKRCIVIKIGSIVFCHGGFLSHHLGKSLLSINQAARKFLRNTPITSISEQSILADDIINPEKGILWTREYITPNALSTPDLVDILETIGAKMVVTGHNTVPYIHSSHEERVWFTDAMFSRAYDSETPIQVLEILDDGAMVRVLGIKT